MDQKYKYDSVRPITAIRYHPDFKNKLVNSWLGPNKGFGTVPGSQWMPYQALHVVTPPFPEYVSGHSHLQRRRGDRPGLVLRRGVRRLRRDPQGDRRSSSRTPRPADVSSPGRPSPVASDEAGWSRRYGGIHFQTGDNHGRALGSQVAQYVYSTAQNYIQGKTRRLSHTAHANGAPGLGAPFRVAAAGRYTTTMLMYFTTVLLPLDVGRAWSAWRWPWPGPRRTRPRRW